MVLLPVSNSLAVVLLKSLWSKLSAITIAIVFQRSWPEMMAKRRCFVEVIYFSQYLYYWLLILFWFVDLKIMEKFLRNRIYHSLADVNADAFKFIPHLFRVFEVHDIQDNLIADTFCNDLLRYTYLPTSFLDLFYR